MLNTASVQQLKQSNISVDNAKTRERIKECYNTATRAQKHEIVSLSGQNRNSLYRAERTGTASAKLILPLAQVMNVSPFYLTGESDDKDRFSDAILLKFLKQYGYKRIISGLENPPAKRQRASSAQTEQKVPETVAEPEPELTDGITMTITFEDTPALKAAAEALTCEEANQLLAALILRAKAGGSAAQMLELVKYCLLS